MSQTTPISEAQLTANRQNATSSTGPRTDAGKSRTRLNGLRHGLTGQTVVMPHEDRAIYEQFRADTIASLQPANDTERALAQSIADDSWRLNRARAIEENIFALDLATSPSATSEDQQTDQALSQAQTFLDHAREIQLLTLYAGRIARAIHKTKTELNTLQAERRKAREIAFEQALLLAQLAKSKGETYSVETDVFTVSGCSAYPGGNESGDRTTGHGFGFSTAELHRIIDRRRRLEEAKSLAKTFRKAA
jgi:hypothetical protein